VFALFQFLPAASLGLASVPSRVPFGMTLYGPRIVAAVGSGSGISGKLLLSQALCVNALIKM
jgi:hypothetical protein